MENKEYSDLVEYIDMAKKTIRAFSNKICPGICKQMANSEDAIADIAYAMMCADWKYDSDRKGKISNKTKTKYSYRNQCGIWAIKTYLTKKSKKVFPTCSLDYQSQTSSNNIHNIIQDKRVKTPLEEIQEKEKAEKTQNFIATILNCEKISSKQKDFIKLYYLENYTYERIAKLYKLRRESVRQSIIRALRNIKKNYTDED